MSIVTLTINRTCWHGVLGVHGLAPQWFEIDTDLFLSGNPSFRFEAEYEALITNYWILTPSVEFDLPFADDHEVGIGAWEPKLEIGARLSYDLIDRAVSLYVGVHYERVFGATQYLKEVEGEEGDGLYFVAGLKLMFLHKEKSRTTRVRPEFVLLREGKDSM